MTKPELGKIPSMVSDLHRVGGGYSVQFSTRNGIFECVWDPTMPTPRDLRRKVDMRKYQVARDSFIANLVARMGQSNAVVLEVTP